MTRQSYAPKRLQDLQALQSAGQGEDIGSRLLVPDGAVVTADDNGLKLLEENESRRLGRKLAFSAAFVLHLQDKVL